MNDKKFSQTVRELIQSSGRSAYWLSYETKLKEEAIRKFVQGKTDLRLKSVNKIVAVLFPNGVQIVPIQSEQPATLPGGQE